MDRELFLEYLNRLEDKVRKIRIIKRSLDLSPVEGKVTAVVGPRRAGKTYLMLDLLKNNPSSCSGSFCYCKKLFGRLD